MDFKYQVLVTVGILVGLFFVEYPPLFAVGYWSWSGTVHKTITGILLIVNLVLAQLAAKKLGYFRHAKEIGRATPKGPRSQATV